MNQDELRQAIQAKAAEVNAALAALNELMGEATKAGLIVSLKLIDIPNQPRLKAVAVDVSERIEVPMQQQPSR